MPDRHCYGMTVVQAPNLTAYSFTASLRCWGRPHLGFTLVEVLVTLLLFCVGALGMVALQGKALVYHQDAVQRMTAAMLAADLLELIRAAPGGAESYLQSQAAAFAQNPSLGQCRSTPAGAAEQLACWAADAAGQLPGAEQLVAEEFYLCRSRTPGSCSSEGSALEIQLAWRSNSSHCLAAETITSHPSAERSICRYRLRSEL